MKEIGVDGKEAYIYSDISVEGQIEGNRGILKGNIFIFLYKYIEGKLKGYRGIRQKGNQYYIHIF